MEEGRKGRMSLSELSARIGERYGTGEFGPMDRLSNIALFDQKVLRELNWLSFEKHQVAPDNSQAKKRSLTDNRRDIAGALMRPSKKEMDEVFASLNANASAKPEAELER